MIQPSEPPGRKPRAVAISHAQNRSCCTAENRLTKPRDCPQLPARIPTTEHTEHTERELSFFRVFGYSVVHKPRGLYPVSFHPVCRPSGPLGFCFALLPRPSTSAEVVPALRANPIGGKQRIPKRCVSTASESDGTRPTRPLCKLQGVASARSYARAKNHSNPIFRMFSFWDVRDQSFPKCFLLNLTLEGTSIHHEAIYLNHPHHRVLVHADAKRPFRVHRPDL